MGHRVSDREGSLVNITPDLSGRASWKERRKSYWTLKGSMPIAGWSPNMKKTPRSSLWGRYITRGEPSRTGTPEQGDSNSLTPFIRRPFGRGEGLELKVGLKRGNGRDGALWKMRAKTGILGLRGKCLCANGERIRS